MDGHDAACRTLDQRAFSDAPLSPQTRTTAFCTRPHTAAIAHPRLRRRRRRRCLSRPHSLLTANAFAAWAESQPDGGAYFLGSGVSATAAVAAVHAAGWMAQFWGHAVHEGRAPALRDNLFQALLAAPLFVLLKLVSDTHCP
jgi:Protein of unknown function (DUF962)